MLGASRWNRAGVQPAIGAKTGLRLGRRIAGLPGELLVKVGFPIPKRAAYQKFRNPASRYAVAGVCVAETAHGVRVAVTGAGSYAFRQSEMEAALTASFTPEALAGIVIPDDDLNSDLHATPAYRAHLVGVMAARAVAAIA